MAGKKTKNRSKPKPSVDPGADASVAIPAVDPESALAAARHVASALTDAPTRARFTRLPSEELDPKHVQAYASLLDAADQAATAYGTAGATETDALVPYALVQRASELKTRMFDCAEHNLKGIADARTRIDVIRPGSGHRDTLKDLRGLAALYDDYGDTLKKDGNYYREADKLDAVSIAVEIQRALAGGQRAGTKAAGRSWARAFDKLRTAHDEIIATGRWLDRNADDVISRWPSLFTAFAVPAKPKKKAKPPATPATPAA